MSTFARRTVLTVVLALGSAPLVSVSVLLPTPCCLLIVFFIFQVEIFLVLGMMSDF